MAPTVGPATGCSHSANKAEHKTLAAQRRFSARKPNPCLKSRPGIPVAGEGICSKGGFPGHRENDMLLVTLTPPACVAG